MHSFRAVELAIFNSWRLCGVATLALALTACTAFRHSAVPERVELMSLESAQQLVKARVPGFEPAALALKGPHFSLLGCHRSVQKVAVEQLDQAHFSGGSSRRGDLFVSASAASTSLCTRGLLLKDMPLEDARRLVLAFNVVGARIPHLLSQAR